MRKLFHFLFFQNSSAQKKKVHELGVVQTERLTELAKSVDPSRLVSGASGWHDKPVGDIIDMHIYLGPGHPFFFLPILTLIMLWLFQLKAKQMQLLPLT